jgi:hypothetical protein
VRKRTRAEALWLRHVERHEDRLVREHVHDRFKDLDLLGDQIRGVPRARLSRSGRRAVWHVVNGLLIGAVLVGCFVYLWKDLVARL